MIKDGVRVDVAFTEHIALFEANSDRQQSNGWQTTATTATFRRPCDRTRRWYP